MAIATIREYRHVPAKRGMRIFHSHNGRYGTILGSRGGYLRIRLDGDTWSENYHPTWKIDYLDNEGKVILST